MGPLPGEVQSVGISDDRNLPVREEILSAVAHAAREFLRASDWKDAVPDVLRRLGEAASASRSYIFENKVVNGVPAQNQIFEWVAPGIRPTINDPDNIDAPYGPQEEEWVRILKGGGIVSGATSAFAPAERDYLQKQEGILSLAFAPIFVGEEWWGYLGFDDCETERQWTPGEIDALRIAAEVVGAAIGRRSLDRRLRRAEDRFRALVESIPAVTYTDAVEGLASTLYMSPQVEEMLGYTAEEWISVPDFWVRLLHPDDREREIRNAERVERTGERYETEYRLIARDGHTVWVHEAADLLRDEEGEPLSWQGVLMDITERKQAEGLLRGAEEKYRSLVEQLPAAVYTETQEGRLTYIGPQALQLFGVTPEQWLADTQTWAGLLHPDDRERILMADRTSDGSGAPFEMEYRLITKDGRLVWVQDVATLVSGAPGETPYWQGLMIDITDRKTAEERLREAEDRFRTLVESISAVTYIDSAQDLWSSLYVSPQVGDVYGCTQEEWLADPHLWEEMLHPEDRGWVTALGTQRAAEGVSFGAEYRIINTRGETIWIHEESNPVPNPDGSPLYWLGVMIDITEAKRAETLERDLALEKATISRLKELDEAKDALLTAVSHDFRAPLSNILGFALTLERAGSERPPKETAEFLHHIVENAWRLDRLVTDVLDVARLREGLISIERRPTDVGGLVQRLAEQSSLPDGYHITIDVEPVAVRVDAQKVERIVGNLFANAVHHNPDGATVRVRVRAAPGGVEISVEDDGRGVPAELRNSLFEEFTSDEESRQGASPGLGIGLSIVKRFTDLHGGKVWYEDGETGGATFRVFLPDAASPPAGAK